MLDWARLRATARLWWRMMRMQRITREGWFYVGFTLVVGAAAINTGNNLLYLVLGLQLSLILLSALLSESALRGIEVRRELPRHAVAGQPFRTALAVKNHKRRFSSFSLVVSELEGPAEGVRVFVARVGPGEEVRALYETVAPRRGEGRFGLVRITTRFPFGFFEKSREQLVPATLAIHPAAVRAPAVRPGPLSGEGERPEPRPGLGHEFHGLREYRPGDDPRTIHWRSSARAGRALVVEHERERRRRVTLLADTRGAQGRAVDGIAEAALALARRFLDAGCEVGLAWNGGALPPDAGPHQLRRLGDAAARLSGARADAPPPRAFAGSHAVQVPPQRPAPMAEAKLLPVHEATAAGSGRLTLHAVQRASLLAAVLSGFASLAISGEIPVWAMAGFGLSALLGLVMREGTAQGLRNGSNVLALGALVFLAAQVTTGAADVIVAAPTFAVALAASRLLGRRGPADDALLLLAALLMLAGGAALTGDLSYGLAFAAFAVTATVALCLSHLRRETEEVDGPQASRRRGTVSGALVGALAVLSVTVLAGSAVVFVTFPRVSAGVMRRAIEPRVGGQTDRIRLGGVGVLKDDPTPVMRVRFPRGAPPAELYWRTMVFERWDGRSWTRPGGARIPVPPARDHVYRFGEVTPDAIVADVEVLGSDGNLPVPGQPLQVALPRPRRGEPAPLLFFRPGGGLEVRGETDGDLRYRITAAPRPKDAELEGLQRQYPTPEVARYLEIPDGLDPRVRELALRIGGGGEPLAVARALERHLESNFAYTLELPGEVADPIAHFLFERKAGHCEFFASALALMLRVNGIPARVAAGYYGATFVEAGNYWLVRQGDAHAWTEAWFPGQGWVRFDATPASVRSGEVEGLWADLVQLVDLLRVRWSDWVLDFDGRSQMEIARSIADAFRRQEGAGRGLAGPVRLLGAALCLAGAGWLALRLRRKLRRQAQRVPPHHRAAVRLFREVKRTLARRGVVLPESATAAEWAEAAAQVAPEWARLVRAAVQAYEATRFGGRPFDAERGRELIRALRRADQASR